MSTQTETETRRIKNFRKVLDRIKKAQADYSKYDTIFDRILNNDTESLFCDVMVEIDTKITDDFHEEFGTHDRLYCSQIITDFLDDWGYNSSQK